MGRIARIPASAAFVVAFSDAQIAGAQPCQQQWALILALQGTEIASLSSIDTGSGPQLYAYAQYFPLGGGLTGRRIIRWSGRTWEAVAEVGGYAITFGVYDDGRGQAMFAGGEFSSIAGVVSPSLARWDGAAWSSVPTGWVGLEAIVEAMCVYDDGTGPILVVAGWFPGGVGGLASSHIGGWDGTTWTGFGSGLAGGSGGVASLATFDDDGAGPNPPTLYAGGWFTWAGGMLARRVARWDGHQWHALGSGIDPGIGTGVVRALCVYNDGSGPALYAGGTFAGIVGVPGTTRLARWNGTQWSAVGPLNGSGVTAMYVFDDGQRGPGLIAGGDFTSVAGVSAPRIARYDRAGWTNLGGGPAGWFTYMTRFDEGPTPTLWVNAGFLVSPGQYTSLARYQYVCEPCYPDCNADGALTSADFQCFQAKFVASDPWADCNTDGALTVQDFGCFQTRFVQGCP